MKIVVSGGRDYADRASVYAALDRANAKQHISLLIHGGCRGADKIAGEWAQERGIFSAAVPALWKAHGKAAGPRRNRAMLVLLRPEGVILFPGGRGTADMRAAAREYGVPVWEPLTSSPA